MSETAERALLMTSERFSRGLTYAEYKARMISNRDRFERSERENAIADEDLAAFRTLPAPLSTAVLTEDWCSDAVATLPLLAALAERTGKFDVRIFYRDGNPDLMDAHLNHGQFRSIPTFIFFDRAWNDLGAWIEKPKIINELRARMRLEIYASDLAFGSPDSPSANLPDDVRERLFAAIWRMREETTAQCNREVLRELRELLVEGAR